MKLDIEKLLEKYYEGETSLEEEKQLRAFFQDDAIPEHLQSHAAQFRFFSDARKEKPSEDAAQWLAEKFEPVKPRVSRVISLNTWSLRMAASVALLAIGFAGGLVYNRLPKDTAGQGGVAVQTEAAEIRQVLRFDPVRHHSASERIKAVNQSHQLPQADREITQTLINTMNFDDNVNVRLAACQSLLRFQREPGVREALIQSLQIQTDPNVQIALIDILVTIKEKRAVEEMQRLIENQRVMKVVRLKAQQGIGSLI